MFSSYLMYLCLASASQALHHSPHQTAFNRRWLFDKIVKEVDDVKNMILPPVIEGVSNLCGPIKHLLGVHYKPIQKGDQPPDLSCVTMILVKGHCDVQKEMALEEGLIELVASDYYPDQPVFMYIPGFANFGTEGSFDSICDALYKEGYKNIVLLDTSNLLRWLYLRSTTYVRYLGEQLAELFIQMAESINPDQIHLIGHSLGAQLSGFTGQHYYRRTKWRIGRITGLDPAGPCFSNLDKTLMLSKNDAAFVDVIHVNGGYSGIWEPVGTVDFYPNEGISQPNCELNCVCSHRRSWEYFAESILNPTAFPAVKCQSWDRFKSGKCNGHNYMGFPAASYPPGTYYLQTNGTSPYGRGDAGTQYRSDQGLIRNITDFVVRIIGKKNVTKAATNDLSFFEVTL